MPFLLHTTSLLYSRPTKLCFAQPLRLGFHRTHGRIIGTNCGALQRASGSARMSSQGGSSGPYWLMKTEPGEWGWHHQSENGGISNWDGVRNALAQIHLRSMRQGDHAFFYHSGKGPAVVGVVEILKAAYPDATDEAGKSVMVDVRALAAFPKPVPLSVIKSESVMRDWILLRQSRLSVMPVPCNVWQRVCELGELEPPLCRNKADTVTLPEDNAREPERIVNPKKRRRKGAEEKAGAETVMSTMEMASVNEPEEQSTQSEAASLEELKTYQRSSSRKRNATVVEPSSNVKTHNSRGMEEHPRADTSSLISKP